MGVWMWPNRPVQNHLTPAAPQCYYADADACFRTACLVLVQKSFTVRNTEEMMQAACIGPKAPLDCALGTSQEKRCSVKLIALPSFKTTVKDLTGLFFQELG